MSSYEHVSSKTITATSRVGQDRLGEEEICPLLEPKLSENIHRKLSEIINKMLS